MTQSRVLFGVSIVFTLTTLACALMESPSTLPPAPTPLPVTLPPAATLIPTSTPAAPAPTGLDANTLRNASYILPQTGETVTLVDGGFTQTDPSNPINVTLVDQMAFADFNQDGAGDAAVLLAENHGGSGVFVYLIVMLNENGQPLQSDAVLVDDRPQINSLAIGGNGWIVLEAVTHDFDDPFCCPTMLTHQEYQWVNGKLRFANYTSQISTGALRAITIDSPIDGAAATGSVTVSGTVASSPFENTLGVRIVDLSGNLLAEMPIMVDSDGIGGPGTFSAEIDLSAAPAGSAVVLELVDLSAMDGAILALDSVVLIVP